MSASTSGPSGGGQQRKPRRQTHVPWQVYMLRCADGTLYTGCTNDLARRLRRHQRGTVKYTRGRLPVALVYFEAVNGRSAAQKREAAIKTLRRVEKLKLASAPQP